MNFDKKTILRGLLYIGGGAIVGYSYYYFIGCNAGGSCPITSNPYISTLYGAFMGVILAIPSKKKRTGEADGSNNK